MPRSKQKRASTSPRGKGGGTGGRLQTLVLFITIAAVGALLASLVYGVWQHFHPPAASANPPAASADPARPLPARPAGRVKVQVLNATSTHGLARTATDVLRDRGFDVLDTGNAPRGTDPGVSMVIDLTGNREMAQQVADALGITRVETRRDPGPMLDVTVVLGRDWRAPAAHP